MHYYLMNSKSVLADIKNYPCVVIKRDSWDDYGFKTTVELSYYESKGALVVLIGQAKISTKSPESGYTEFPKESFECLSNDYFSLGQTIEYYENIRKYNLGVLLKDLRDCATNVDIYEAVHDLPVFENSLIRSSRAQLILNEAKAILNDGLNIEDRGLGDPSFEYSLNIPQKNGMTTFSFNFKNHKVLPFRINILVGRNGTGKSQILSNLAIALSGMKDKDSNVGDIKTGEERSLFSDIYVMSYSPFDSFKTLDEINNGKVTKSNKKSGLIPYNFFGIRKLSENNDNDDIILKSHNEIKSEITKSYNTIINKKRINLLDEILMMGLGEAVYVDGALKTTRDYSNYSSGQKILIKMLLDIISSINRNDIILIDEPETYLHPQGISNFYHCLLKILNETESYCIMSTHSPILVQETPSKYVHVLKRRGRTIIVENPKTETLGQGISNIINDIFGVNADDRNFFKTLEKLASSGLSLDELEHLLEHPLDFTARNYFNSIISNNGG